MPFSDLDIQAALGVLAVPVDNPAPRDEGADRAMVAAFSSEYTQASGSGAAGDPSGEAAPLVLESRGSQITIASSQAALDVKFYGGHQHDAGVSREYFGERLASLLDAWVAVGARPVWANIVINLKSVFGTAPDEAGAHIRDHFLAEGLANQAVYDLKAQIGIRVADHFFVNLGVSPYEAKQVKRTAAADAPAATVIRPWEGEVTEAGIELNIEVNNRLRANVLRQHSAVDEEELREMNDLSWDFVTRVANPLVRDGQLDLSQLEAMTG